MTATTTQKERLKTEQTWVPATTPGATQPDSAWSETTAQRIAAESGMQLSEAHWEVIRYVRDYYTERGFVRRSRELSNALNARFSKEGGIKYLYRLFSGGPVLQACRLGGIPVPENCVDSSFGTAF